MGMRRYWGGRSDDSWLAISSLSTGNLFVLFFVCGLWMGCFFHCCIGGVRECVFHDGIPGPNPLLFLRQSVKSVGRFPINLRRGLGGCVILRMEVDHIISTYE